MSTRNILKRFLQVLGIFALFVVIYFIAAFGFSFITVNNDFKQCENDAVEIYVKSNGVHTDIVVPLVNSYKDWTNLINPAETKSNNSNSVNVAFGWGDKGFYLKTKTWGDLKFNTAFKALFYLSTSAMHVTFYDNLSESESCRKICIDKESYLKLVDYISKSFTKDSTGRFVLIHGASYSDNDLFYEANGTYSLFFTCNTWSNKALKTAGAKACLWTPFDRGIFWKYDDN